MKKNQAFVEYWWCSLKLDTDFWSKKTYLFGQITKKTTAQQKKHVPAHPRRYTICKKTTQQQSSTFYLLIYFSATKIQGIRFPGYFFSSLDFTFFVFFNDKKRERKKKKIIAFLSLIYNLFYWMIFFYYYYNVVFLRIWTPKYNPHLLTGSIGPKSNWLLHEW